MTLFWNLSNKYFVSLGITSVSVSDSNVNPLRCNISFKGWWLVIMPLCTTRNSFVLSEVCG